MHASLSPDPHSPHLHILLSRLPATTNAPPQVSVTADLLTNPSITTLTCHCASCKRRSGGLASYAFCVPGKYVTIASPPSSSAPSSGGPSGSSASFHSTYTDPDTQTGKPMQRTMCSRCGSPVAVIEGSEEGKSESERTVCLQYGLFAEELEGRGGLPRPQLEMFASRRCVWEEVMGREVRETQ